MSRRPRPPNAEARRVMQAARDLGYEVSIGGSGHMRFVHPITGAAITAAGTPRCPYAAEHAIRELRRAAR